MRAYGVRWPIVGLAHRATFVVGRDRRIGLAHRSELNIDSHVERALEAVAARD